MRRKYFAKFYKVYVYCLPRAENAKQAWYLAEKIWERRTGKRYHKNYESFRSNLSQRRKRGTLDVSK